MNRILHARLWILLLSSHVQLDISRVKRRKSKMAAYHCCVPLCVNDSRKKNPEISFHSFPTEPKRRAEWIVKIRRDPGDLFQVCF